jgi:hypothetical protein
MIAPLVDLRGSVCVGRAHMLLGWSRVVRSRDVALIQMSYGLIRYGGILRDPTAPLLRCPRATAACPATGNIADYDGVSARANVNDVSVSEGAFNSMELRALVKRVALRNRCSPHSLRSVLRVNPPRGRVYR